MVNEQLAERASQFGLILDDISIVSIQLWVSHFIHHVVWYLVFGM